MIMGKRRAWICVFLFTLQAITYADRVSLSVVAKPVAADLALSPVAMGYLLSSFLWSYLLCLIPMGILVDRYGTKIIIGAGIAIWSLATILTGGAWNVGTLIAMRLVMGLGEASTHPAGARVVREWIPASERGIANAVFISGSYAGPALGAMLAAWISDMAGWRTAFFVVGTLGFVWLAAWLIWFGRPETVTWLSEEERAKIIRERNAGTAALNERSKASQILRLLRKQTIWGLALTQSCAVYTQYLFLTWLPNYLQATKHLTILKTGLFTAVPYACAVVLIIGLGTVSDRLLLRGRVATGGRRLVVVGCLLGSSIILVAPWVDNVAILLALITLSLTGMGTAVSFNFALLNDLLKSPQDVGKAMSILVIGGNLFGAAAPIVTGYVIQVTGSYDWAFGIAGFFLIVGSVIALTMTRNPVDLSAPSDGRCDTRGMASLPTGR
jgi:MFS family permease